MNVEIQHVPLAEVPVHERLLAPIVVSDLFRNLASFTSHGQEPVIPVLSQTDVFDVVPKVLSLRWIGKKSPVVVLAKQVVGPRRHRGFSSRNRLAARE